MGIEGGEIAAHGGFGVKSAEGRGERAQGVEELLGTGETAHALEGVPGTLLPGNGAGEGAEGLESGFGAAGELVADGDEAVGEGAPRAGS